MFRLPSGLYFRTCLGSLFLSILCTCCSHFFWYCFISFTIFCAPVFSLIHWFFSLSNFVIPIKCLKNFICAASKRCSSLFLLVGRFQDRFPMVSLGIVSVVLPTEPCALRSTQPLKVSTRDFSWGKGGRCFWLTKYHPCSAETSRKSGALIYPEPLGPLWPVVGDLYFYPYYMGRTVYQSWNSTNKATLCYNTWWQREDVPTGRCSLTTWFKC